MKSWNKSITRSPLNLEPLFGQSFVDSSVDEFSVYCHFDKVFQRIQKEGYFKKLMENYREIFTKELEFIIKENETANMKGKKTEVQNDLRIFYENLKIFSNLLVAQMFGWIIDPKNLTELLSAKTGTLLTIPELNEEQTFFSRDNQPHTSLNSDSPPLNSNEKLQIDQQIQNFSPQLYLANSAKQEQTPPSVPSLSSTPKPQSHSQHPTMPPVVASLTGPSPRSAGPKNRPKSQRPVAESDAVPNPRSSIDSDKNFSRKKNPNSMQVSSRQEQAHENFYAEYASKSVELRQDGPEEGYTPHVQTNRDPGEKKKKSSFSMLKLLSHQGTSTIDYLFYKSRNPKKSRKAEPGCLV